MLLNRLEKAAMNNPIRAAFQRFFEARRLLRMGGACADGNALEIGCGRGVGIELILDLFGARHVDAFDVDPEMVSLARARTAKHGERVRVWQGDAASIASPDAQYDAVFDFGIIHHVPEWRKAVQEVFRVLKPGGRFYVEEMLARFIENPIGRRFFAHPHEDRFDCRGFEHALAESGFKIAASHNGLGLVAWFIAVKPA